LAYEPAPMVLAFVLGPLLEKNLRKALLISDGNLDIFLTRPLSGASLLITLLLLLSAVIQYLQKRKQAAISE